MCIWEKKNEKHIACMFEQTKNKIKAKMVNKICISNIKLEFFIYIFEQPLLHVFCKKKKILYFVY